MKPRMFSITAGGAAMRYLFAACLLVAANTTGVRAGPPGSAHGNRGYDDGVITNTDRIVLHENIVHYRYDVRVGPGEFDVIRLHRIVKERWPHRPVSTVDGVFMVPGSPNFFESIFMAPSVSSALPWDHSVAAYLAKHNVDVWGTDYAWALVPAETTDFSFMRDWGLEREMRDIDIALGVAQKIRRATGECASRLHLLGFSHGVPIAYALAGEETQKPYPLRKIKGLIPVDYLIKTDDEAFSLNGCNALVANQARFDAGIYEFTDGANLKLFAVLAETAPNDPSPAVSTFSNLEFFRFVLTSGQFWHFTGGDSEQLLFSDIQVWLDLAKATPPYSPVQASLDVNKLRCGTIDVPFDDHLGEITVPILYVGAAGGAGHLGEYSVSLTSSTDVTIHIVGPLISDLRSIDFGHADLFLAEDAEVLVWQPMLEWIKAHARPGVSRLK